MTFYANRGGYTFSGTELRSDYRVLPYVSKKDTPAETAKSFVVDPVLNPV